MKFNGAKVKLSRKLGIALTAKAAKYMEKRPYGPGVHAAGGRQRRLSDYGAQLLEELCNNISCDSGFLFVNISIFVLD